MDINVFIYWLSWCALVTTIGLFFTGIPICMNIYRMKTTGDISGVPLFMGFLGGSFWLRYGFLKGDATMIQVNVVSSLLFFCYCIFYLIYADPKKDFAVKFIAVLAMVIGMLFWMQYSPNVDYLGFLCMTFNIINFGAPLAGLGVVLKKKCTDSLPLPMCCCNLLVSSEWFLYGTLIRDRYIIIPNAIGMALAVIQLSLFIIFPRKAQDPSPIQRLFGSKRMPQNDYEKESFITSSQEPMNQRNEQNNSPVLGEPSFASTHSSSTLPSLYRKPDSESRLEKRLSNSFIEDSQQSEVHSEMRSRSNSVPELKLTIA